MLQFTLTGRLAADPELTTYGTDNTPMARLRIASNQPGSERTDFFDVAVFGDNRTRGARRRPQRRQGAPQGQRPPTRLEHRQRRDPRAHQPRRPLRRTHPTDRAARRHRTAHPHGHRAGGPVATAVDRS